MNNHSDIINTCISSARQSIKGFYFFNSIKNAWFIVVKADFLYVSFEYTFGDRWTKNQHLILESKKVSKEKTRWLESCSKQDFSKVRV